MDYKKTSKIILKELDEVFQRISYEDVRKAIQIIKDKKRIFVLGVGREGLATRAFAMRLMHLGKEVHWCWDDTTPGITEEDLLIATSGSGEIGHIHYVVSEVKQTKAFILLFTGVTDRKTAMLADSVIWVPASVYKGKDNVVPSMQPMGNLFEQSLFILFDMMIMSLESELNQTHDEMSMRHRNFE